MVVRLTVMALVAISDRLTRGFGHTLAETSRCPASPSSRATQRRPSPGFSGASRTSRARTRSPPPSVIIGVLGTGSVLALTRPPGPVLFVRVDQLRHHRGEEVKLHGIARAIERTSGDVTRIYLVENGAEVLVEAHGPLPDTLRERAAMIARGHLDGDVFIATEVLAKCPDTYRIPDGTVPATRFRD
jgi:cytochrome c-type biogenesis protein CcmE